MSGDVSGAQVTGRKDGGKGGEGGLPCPFLKIEKIALIMGENGLTVFIHRINVHLCSNALI